MSNGINGTAGAIPFQNLYQPDGAGKAAPAPGPKAGAAAAAAGAVPPVPTALLALVTGGGASAPRGAVPADPSQSLASAAAAQQLLATFASSGSTLDMLARLMVEQAGQQRKSALDDRMAARDQAKTELLDQASKMREAANTLSSGALTSLIMTVVSASLQVAGGLASLGGSMSAASKQAAAFKDVKGLANTPPVPAAATGSATTGTAAAAPSKFSGMKFGDVQTVLDASQTVGKSAQHVGKVGEITSQTAGQLGQGMTRYNEAGTEAASKVKDAEGQEAAARAQDQQAGADIRKDQQEALDQMIKSIIQFLKDMQDAKADQMRALTRV